jgi:integrase
MSSPANASTRRRPGDDDGPVPMTVRAALAQYYQRVSIHKRGALQEKYRAATINKSALAGKILSEVSTIDIAAYRDARLATISPRTSRVVSHNTVRLELALLSDLFQIARIEWGACGDNPVTTVRKPKLPPGRDRRISWGEERKILRAAAKHRNPEFLAIITLAIETAMRQGEILGLLWENVRLRARIAHLPHTKNGSKRDIPLSIHAVETLERLGPKLEGPVFSYTSDGFKAAWRTMIKRLDLVNLHFHDLRHEAISRLFELGTLDMMEVATISGHKSMQMLRRYTHLKASNLVAKLDGRKELNRAKHVISRNMLPYPARVSDVDGLVHLNFIDFGDIKACGLDMSNAVAAASDLLLRKLVTLIRDSEKPPVPTSLSDFDSAARVVLVNPL